MSRFKIPGGTSREVPPYFLALRPGLLKSESHLIALIKSNYFTRFFFFLSVVRSLVLFSFFLMTKQDMLLGLTTFHHTLQVIYSPVIHNLYLTNYWEYSALCGGALHSKLSSLLHFPGCFPVAHNLYLTFQVMRLWLITFTLLSRLCSGDGDY